MSTTNIDHRLDLAIDALNREQAPAANDGELASLVNAARLIKSLRPPAEPDAGFPALALDRIMASLDQPVALAAEPPLDDDPPRGITGWLHKYSELAAILVIGLVVIGGIFIYQTVWSDDGGAPAAEPPELIEGFDVYRVTGTTESAAHLQQIDPETLDDIEAGHRFDITFPYVLSQDGSTVVWIETGPNQERIIVVGDGLGGSEQLRFQPPVWTGSPILSNDGSRLLLMGRLEAGSEPPFWYIYDTATGELVSTIQRDSRLGMDQIFFSPDGATLYQVWTAPANSPDAPEPLQIITYDTSSGEKTGTVSLSDVPAGYGNLDPMIQVQESTFLRPTAIISPNGNIIAISHADQHIITIVNAETLEIEKSFSLDIPTSTPDEPSPAPYARSEIVFTPDSSQLYFFGWVVGSLPSANQFGLMLVDIEQGAIVATGQEGLQVQHILPTPDGESLYVFSTQPFALGIDDEQIIHRLDASTLEIKAERSFVEFNVIIIDPMPRERPDQPPASPAPTNDPDAFPTPDELGMYRNLTFEQAQELVSFELIQPSVVPAPLEFAGIFVTTPPRPNPDGTIVFDDPVEVIAIYRDSRDDVPDAPFAEFRQGTHAVSITNPDAVETNVEIGGHAIAKFRMEREDGVVVTNWLWESAGMHYTITAYSLTVEFEIAIEEMIAALPEGDEPAPVNQFPEDPVEFIFAYHDALVETDMDTVREMLLEEFREFETIYHNSPYAGITVGDAPSPDDWIAEPNDQFTVVRFVRMPMIAYVLRQQPDGGWLVDPGLDILRRGQHATAHGFDPAIEKRTPVQKVHADGFEPGLFDDQITHVEPDGSNIRFQMLLQLERAEGAHVSLSDIEWSAGSERGAVEITWTTARISEDMLHLPEQPEMILTYQMEFTLLDVPDGEDITLHLRNITFIVEGSPQLLSLGYLLRDEDRPWSRFIIPD